MTEDELKNAETADQAASTLLGYSPWEIHRMIVLSTAHLDTEIVDGLYLLPSWAVMAGEHGWLCYVSPNGESIDDYEMLPQCILDARRYARELKCTYILFDSDGPIVNGLKTWDW